MNRLTPWYPAGVKPVRDGLYLTGNQFGEFVMRWHGGTSSWYDPNSTGSDQADVIGWDRPNFASYDWRGIAQQPWLLSVQPKEV